MSIAVEATLKLFCNCMCKIGHGGSTVKTEVQPTGWGGGGGR